MIKKVIKIYRFYFINTLYIKNGLYLYPATILANNAEITFLLENYAGRLPKE